MANIKISPSANKVVVIPIEAKTETSGGIIIPDTAKEKSCEGKVIAVGPGIKDEKMQVKVGDKVLYGKHSGARINIEDKEYLVLKQSDILLRYID